MTDIVISKKNEVYLQIECEPHIKLELNDYFTFEVPNAKYMAQYRSRRWDGKIRLFSPAEGKLYVGLFQELKHWMEKKKYSYEIKENNFYGSPDEVDDDISPEGIRDYLQSLKIPLNVRGYQLEAVYQALHHYRKLLLSPTASGKSLMIYSLVRYYTGKNLKTLVIVPNTSLVEQLSSDFNGYGWDSEQFCHKIHSGKIKNSSLPVIITTWQSIYKMPKSWFDQFDAVIGDEAHNFKAKSLVAIMTKLHNCKYRVGFTGTLDGSNTNELILTGLFGPVKKTVQTSKLIEDGHLSNLSIKVLLLRHESIQFETYQDELNYICSNERRNQFITKLALDQTGNTLILFNYVEKHGKILHEMINSNKRKVYFVHGGTETEDRENIRNIAELENDAIIIASYGTFSTGINIKNLHQVIFASPSKSRIRNLQSIGRVLRKSETKSSATLFDIADDFSHKERRNYTLNHMIERLKIYSSESFKYEIIPVNFRSKT